jgi:hypothetical protein
MSLDDGQEGFDIDRVKARLRGELRKQHLTFEKACEHAALSPSSVLRALDTGSDGFPETLQALQRLSVGLGRGPNWLPFAIEDSATGQEDESIRVQNLVWEFIYKASIEDKQMRERLLSAALTPLAFVEQIGVRFRRQNAPRNLKDVLEIYNRLLKEDLWKP